MSLARGCQSADPPPSRRSAATLSLAACSEAECPAHACPARPAHALPPGSIPLRPELAALRQRLYKLDNKVKHEFKRDAGEPRERVGCSCPGGGPGCGLDT